MTVDVGDGDDVTLDDWVGRTDAVEDSEGERVGLVVGFALGVGLGLVFVVCVQLDRTTANPSTPKTYGSLLNLGIEVTSSSESNSRH